MALKPDRIRALTLDLDDTLWAVRPVIARAESALQAWLAQHAPGVSRHFDADRLQAVRASVSRDFPHWAHDLTAQRREAIRRVLHLAGEDEALAEPAFEVFFAARQQVELFDDVPQALAALSRRWPLMALSNGNADVHRTGLGGWFSHSLSAREAGVGKPDRRIFEQACARLGLSASEVLHVGDDLHLDVRGAAAAGLQTAWLQRDGLADPPADPDGDPRTDHAPDWQGRDLLGLVQALGAGPA